MKRANPEAQLQRAVAEFLDRVLRRPTIYTAIGHGGGGKVRGAQLKAMGLKRGWSDIIVLHPAKYWTIALGLELKSKDGRASAEQLQHRNGMVGVNGHWHLCRSLDDVMQALIMCGIPCFGR